MAEPRAGEEATHVRRSGPGQQDGRQIWAVITREEDYRNPAHVAA